MSAVRELMRHWLIASIVHTATAVSLTAAVLSAIVWLRADPVTGQSRGYRAPRTKDGRPNLSGIWQAVNTANWDLQDHAARPSPVVALGARGASPAGSAVVEGGEIPYQPAAAVQKMQNFEMLYARRAACDVYAVSVPDRPGFAFRHLVCL
jgi:hypothetical protein